MSNSLSILLLLLSFIFMSCGDPTGQIVDDKEPPVEDEKNKGYDVSYILYNNDTTLENKLFYFLTALNNSSAKQQVIENSTLKTVKDKYGKLFDEFDWNNYSDLPALGRALLLSSDDNILIEKELEEMSSSPSFNNLIKNHVRPSGKYEKYLELDNEYLIRAIWRESIAKGINTILEQYLIGVPPKYSSDGLKYSLSSNEYKELVESQMNAVKELDDRGLFYTRLVGFVLGLLEINDRDEAVRFEPLDKGENRLAINNLSGIKWSDYNYASILLLGDSPNSAGDDINLSNSAKIRIQYAVDALKANLAPVIIISGANIYPYQTRYFEAVEMKKWMMQTHGIDERKIIIDPVARHTTTNLRNGSRLIFKYKIPSDIKSVIITTKTQNDIIIDPSFRQRCVNELGYMPVEIGQRLSNERLEFTPLVVSMHFDTLDPLDP